MITVSILEEDDLIDPNDWCRPLAITSMSGGHSDHYSFRSEYSGTPCNNAEWARVKAVIGECWFGSPIKKFHQALRNCGPRYEFIRGEVPKSHRLSMTGYTDLSKSSARRKKQVEDDYDDIPF